MHTLAPTLFQWSPRTAQQSLDTEQRWKALLLTAGGSHHNSRRPLVQLHKNENGIKMSAPTSEKISVHHALEWSFVYQWPPTLRGQQGGAILWPVANRRMAMNAVRR